MTTADELMGYYYENVEDKMVSRMKETVKDELFKDYPERLRYVAEELLEPKELQKMKQDTDRYNWKKRHYNNSRLIEGFDVLQSTKDAIISRRYHFNDISGNDTSGNDTSGNIQVNAESTALYYKNLVTYDFNRYKKIFESHINSYSSLHTYVKSLKLMADGKRNELNKLNNKIDTYSQNFNIDGRKDDYENKNYDFYYSIQFYVLILYYSLIILYFIFSDYFKESRYKHKYTNIYIIIYILLPFFIKSLLSSIYNIYIFILEKLNLIDDDIISYPYIIDDKNI